MRLCTVLYILICAHFLVGIVYITQININHFPLANIELVFGQIENDEWLDLNGEIFFRLSLAQYLVDMRRVLIFATCSNSVYKHLDKLNFSFQIEMLNKAKIKINTLILKGEE